MKSCHLILLLFSVFLQADVTAAAQSLVKRFWLKSGVHLYLEGGSCLRFKGSSAGLDREFVKTDPKYPKEGCPGGYFIRATGGKNIRISGRGVIDCNGEKLYDKDKWIISALRPMHVERISIEGVIITDATSWTASSPP